MDFPAACGFGKSLGREALEFRKTGAVFSYSAFPLRPPGMLANSGKGVTARGTHSVASAAEGILGACGA